MRTADAAYTKIKGMLSTFGHPFTPSISPKLICGKCIQGSNHVEQVSGRKARIEVADFRGNRMCIWQQQYELKEEEDEEEEGVDHPITKEEFHGVTCGRCRDEIHMYHRYYYNCSSCDFSLHKFCAELELPEILDHPSHKHALTFFQNWNYSDGECKVCEQKVRRHEMCYDCLSCFFPVHVKCAVGAVKKMIHHPCHPHSLITVTPKPILCECSACGKEHKGVFFQCTTCVTNFIIHSDCAFLPKTLLIQQTTHNAFHHTHPLTISYSFPIEDQRAKYRPKCRVCGDGFEETWYLWIYKCDKCMYYAHLDCATSRSEPFMSIFLSAGFGKTVKNYKDADHARLLHLPFPDETYSIQKHLLFQQTGTSDHEVSLTHMSHQHPLILVDLRQCNDQTSSFSSSNNINSCLLLMCHDPIKKTQLLCNACLRPITSTMPFYKCAETCNFTLHEWCTRLPQEIQNHPGHPDHPLLLKYSNVLPHFFGVFDCAVCELPCNGFAYCCEECGYYVDVTCGLLPKHITHEAHPNHLLSLVPNQSVSGSCRMCLQSYSNFSFSCKSCDIWVHPECALLLPKAIRHKYDKKHPMHLSYFPIENHKSKYFCEICEMDFNPHRSFYHCHDCVQSIHTACAPLILQCETYTHTRYYNENVYYFVNIKFGGIHNTDGHQHPLTFAQGIESDGRCSRCRYNLQYYMIFKCLECNKYAVDYDCCKRLDKR